MTTDDPKPKKTRGGSATFTAHLAVAVSPEMKNQLEDAARQRLMNGYGVVARMAIAEWLERNYTPSSTGNPHSNQAPEAGA
jgi:hypothetical protein